jgi:hypothetical protein
METNIALAADKDGNLYAAYTLAGSGLPSLLWVQQYSQAEQAWKVLGGGPLPANFMPSHPSITIIGEVPWVAFLDQGTTAMDLVNVVRYNPSQDDWFPVGNTLNDMSLGTAHDPVIVGVGPTPYVAFRQEEPAIGLQQLIVKYWGPGPTP